ncbi:MAG: ferritin-like domain-containing protein [Myxococcales bacterium]|nr:ferritin-like domain-containing protein [Myxococcales bacterium]
MTCLIAATLAAAGCRSTVDDCEGNEESFILDKVLYEERVNELLTTFDAAKPEDLFCDDVCGELYQDIRYAEDLTIDTCKLHFTGGPDQVLGSVSCSGDAVLAYCLGRRPLGHIEQSLAAPDLGAYLAHAASLEAASVLAFSQLADRLQRWRAPARLIRRCHAAAADEAEHARLLTELALAAGATVAPPLQRELPVDLAAAARDNAIAGCVHEAWSALTCAVTARDAASPELRAVHRRLAADEARHAQLAWDLHTWFMKQVSTIQRASIRAAQAAAIAALPALARAHARAAPPALALPDAPLAARFAAGLVRAA